MTERNYTAIPSPEIKSLLDGALPQLAAEIGDLRLPKLAGVVLGGGYGRGEGGVLHTSNGDKLYNDLDFFVFADRASRNGLADIDRELGKLSAPWEKRLGVAVDFGPAKNLASLKNVSHTLMYQELLHGWRPVWGNVDLDSHLPDLPPAELPFTEAARLLLNRGMGLLFAANRLPAGPEEGDFIVRNMNKCVLGCGDALLIAAGRYRWSGSERVAEFGAYCRATKFPEKFADMYEEAFRFKLEPHPDRPHLPVDMWRRCREFYLAAFAAVTGARKNAGINEICAALREKAGTERSFKNFLRWLIRMRSFRPPDNCFDNPIVTVLESLYPVLEQENPPRECPQSLYRMWRIFN